MANRANLAVNAIGLALSGASGIAAARDLGDHTDRAYEVIFEENADGRLRARVTTFSLESDAGGTLYAWHLFMNGEGVLQQSPASYRMGMAEINDPAAIVAGHPWDPLYSGGLGNPAFSGGSL